MFISNYTYIFIRQFSIEIPKQYAYETQNTVMFYFYTEAYTASVLNTPPHTIMIHRYIVNSCK